MESYRFHLYLRVCFEQISKIIMNIFFSLFEHLLMIYIRKQVTSHKMMNYVYIKTKTTIRKKRLTFWSNNY